MDPAGNMIQINTTSPATDLQAEPSLFSLNNVIGLLLALSSSFFIGASFVINKKSLQKINQPEEEDQEEEIGLDETANLKSNSTSNQGKAPTKALTGLQILKSPLWWLATLTLASGEIANFSAYIFSPASLVTPLGALSVVVTCVLSAQFLNERLNLFSKIGVGLAVLGSMFVVIHAPESEMIESLDRLYQEFVCQKLFLIFATLEVVTLTILLFFKDRHYIIRILLSAISGSFCVIFTKATGIGVTQFIKTWDLVPLLTNWFFYVCLLGLATTISFQLMQITQALNLQPASTVMPIYYVTFTVLVMVSMNILFREYEAMAINQILSIGIGFMVLCCAVYMLHGFAGLKIYTAADVKKWST